MAHAALNPDQIIFKYSYQREDIKDNNLDDANLETRCPLDNGRHSGTPEQTVGQLDLLPLEIVNEILLSMDLPTLTNFRCINRRAMQLVDSLPQYRMVFKHCPNVLRAILSTNANSYDCRLLYNTLATTRCSSCSNFGSYLYLITCKRVCHLCFRRRPDYVPVAAHGASKITGVSKTQLDRVPRATSLPGQYGHLLGSLNSSRRRTVFLDTGTLRPLVRDPAPLDTIPAVGNVRDSRRFMFTVSAPCLDRSGQTADWGVYCQRCRGNRMDPTTHGRNKYTREGFLEHYREWHEGNPW